MWFWAFIIILAVWWLLKRNKTAAKKPQRELLDSSPKDITEEMVLKVQTRFEKDLQNTDLPDAIRFSDLYIYRNLMSKWFSKLSAEHRYDDVMTQKLRKDWLDYMNALQDGHTSNYLSLESYGDTKEEQEKSDSYREDATHSARKALAIEDGFAAAIGKDQVDELTRIRKLSMNSISREGELAPEGMEFDILGKLRSKNNK
jgi:hypothetical protein